jgi:hypothetical protein
MANKKTTKKVVRKTESKAEIRKKLSNPKISNSEKARLMEKLYSGIEFRK